MLLSYIYFHVHQLLRLQSTYTLPSLLVVQCICVSFQLILCIFSVHLCILFSAFLFNAPVYHFSAFVYYCSTFVYHTSALTSEQDIVAIVIVAKSGLQWMRERGNDEWTREGHKYTNTQIHKYTNTWAFSG